MIQFQKQEKEKQTYLYCRMKKIKKIKGGKHGKNNRPIND